MLVLGNLLLQAAPAGAEVSVQSGGQCGHKLHPVHTRHIPPLTCTYRAVRFPCTYLPAHFPVHMHHLYIFQ